MQGHDAVQAPLRSRFKQPVETPQLFPAQPAAGEEGRRGDGSRKADDRHRAAHPQVRKVRPLIPFAGVVLHPGAPAPDCFGDISVYVTIMIPRHN